jgi:hypothetical protein
MEQPRKEVTKEGLTYLNEKGEPRPRPEVAIERDARIRAAGARSRLDPSPEKRIGGYGVLGPPPWEKLK